MEQTPEEVLTHMTLDEKAGLCSGLGFWHTKPIERLGVPSIMLTDGPHGLRKQIELTDQLGISNSVPSTCFPTAAITSCSFDRELLREIGQAIGEEMLKEKVSVVLGPGLNIKRSPLCGRNFEYFSEDPLLSGELAAAFVQGVQSQGVGACLKHYVANNQETARMTNDSIIDERTMREIYLAAFEIAVKKSKPWTIMCAYNKINGFYACEHAELLNHIPRGEWGFKGLIMTDWGAMDDRVWALKSGLDLEMPYAGPANDRKIIEAVRSGMLEENVIDQSANRVLETVHKIGKNKIFGRPFSIGVHDQLARRAVCESAVLLKNDGILPIESGKSIAIIGEFAEKPHYQGAGSSKINPFKITNALDAFENEKIAYAYCRGYDLQKKDDPDQLIAEAVSAAKNNDAVLIFAGLPEEDESEGYDRENIDLPEVQNKLIEEVAKVNRNIAVVLHNGSAVQMPWIDKVNAVLLLGLGGQCVGAAAVDLLFGRANPSGKLSETYPLELQDNPSYLHFGKRQSTEYRESIYVGYRYYEKAKKPVLFPFGHGLSYTQFEYNNLSVSKDFMQEDENVKISFLVKNTGKSAGKEIAQLYISAPQSTLFKPEKELRDFAKVSLEPGEEKSVIFELNKRSFAYWNVIINDWHVESGIYKILIGSSSQDIRLAKEIKVRSTQEKVSVPDYRETAPKYYDLKNEILDIPLEQFEVLYGKKIPQLDSKPRRPFTLQSTLFDAQGTLVGKILLFILRRLIKKFVGTGSNDDDSMLQMIERMLLDFPFRSFGMMGFSEEIIEGILDLLNHKYFKGIRLIIKARRETAEEK